MMLTNDPILEFQGEYRFLSNFWPCTVYYKGIPLPSVEHAYVLHKLDITEDTEIVEVSKMTAGQVKRFGRTKPIADGWDDIKARVMENLIVQKFSTQNPGLPEKLVATGDALLVEGNTWGDRFWGQSPIGNGQNILGKLLMKRREFLISGYK